MLNVQEGLDRLLQGVQLSAHEEQFVAFWADSMSNLSRAIYGMGQYLKRSVSAPEVFDIPVSYAAERLEIHVSPRNREVVRAAIVLAYLTTQATEWLDLTEPLEADNRVSRLVGEVRRYAARKQRVPAAEIPLSPGLVHEYCDAFRLERIEPLLMERLGYQSQS